jgi:adenine-specific DNA methylase
MVLPAGAAAEPVFPATRYQGSKAKIIGWLSGVLRDLGGATLLDAFGGTGVVGYTMKRAGLSVTYNDLLTANVQVGLALIENRNVTLHPDRVHDLLEEAESSSPGFIASTFDDIYFTHDENVWLDHMAPAIGRMEEPHERAIAYFALFQACIAKRPYNLFHRKNLYMRLAEVDRSFGNKATWDTPFPEMFQRFVSEANRAVFDNGHPNFARHGDAAEITGDFDVVYIDTPYVSGKGVSVDYGQFYHFLDGLVRYDEWPHLVDMSSKHRRLKPIKNEWNDKRTVREAFDRLFQRHASSKLAVSYRSDGIPTIDELADMMREHKSHVEVVPYGQYTYVLSKNNSSREVLIVGT